MYFTRLPPVLLLPLSERSVISYQVLQLAQVTSSYVAGADGKDAAIDVTVTVPLARFNVAAAADEAFNRKVQGTAQACQDQGIAFFPVAVETLGNAGRLPQGGH